MNYNDFINISPVFWLFLHTYIYERNVFIAVTVEHNNKIAKDSHMVSCIIDFI